MIGNHLVLACSINLIEGCDTRVTAKRPVVYSALSEPCQARQSQRISAGLSAGVPNHAPKPRTQATHPSHAPKPRTQTTHPNHAPKPRTQATHPSHAPAKLPAPPGAAFPGAAVALPVRVYESVLFERWNLRPSNHFTITSRQPLHSNHVDGNHVSHHVSHHITQQLIVPSPQLSCRYIDPVLVLERF